MSRCGRMSRDGARCRVLERGAMSLLGRQAARRSLSRLTDLTNQAGNARIIAKAAVGADRELTPASEFALHARELCFSGTEGN